VTVPLGAEREVTIRKPGFQPLARRFHATADLTIAVRLDPEAPPRRTRRETEKTPKKVSTPLDSAAGTIDPFSR
jgi:hypothetical protein